MAAQQIFDHVWRARMAAAVYFTARNSGNGLFGRFTAASTDLIEGSAQ
jgi:hypothetical protein